MKRSLIAIAILGLVFFFAVRAMADTLTFNGVNPGQTVSVYINPLGNISPLAGMYNFTLSGGSFDGSYKGFCVDPSYAYSSPNYSVIPVTDGSRYEAAAYLLGKYYGTTSTDAGMAAKVQLAIWELVFDFGGAYNLDNGNFKYSSGYASAVNDLIIEASTAAAGGNYYSGYYVAQSPAGTYGQSPQDFIFRKVPEPGTLVLLGAALFGLGLISRKRRNG